MFEVWKSLRNIGNFFAPCFQTLFRKMIGLGNLFRRTEERVPRTEQNSVVDQPDEATGQPGKTQQLSKIEKVDVEQLRARLQDARVEYPATSHHFFVPDSDKVSIISEEVVAGQIYAARPDLGPDGARYQAVRVCAEARNLFAILAYLRKGQEICAFLNEGISDKDLPFERIKNSNSKFALQRKNGDRIKALESWETAELESLGRKQWCMIAPVFKDKMKHETPKFHMNTVLPFIDLAEDDDEEPISNSGGAYSEVFTTRIHPAHHEFHSHWVLTDRDHKVAIKRLHNYDSKEFEKERSIHTILGQKQRASPHLVRLLATYEYDKRYHFIFPRADCNLRKYWNNNPTPLFLKKRFLWSLKQMNGIAAALNTIHNFRVTFRLDGKGRTSTGEREFIVKDGEELFGRHGDIKPENILWFRQIPEHQYQDVEGQDGGVLQITDFGLGRFHGRDSKTEQQPNGVFGSPTYEPPECRLHRPVSRAYDLWSLGCLYLEFATWLILGFKAIDDFSTHRLHQSSLNPKFSEDYFFTVVKDEAGGMDAKVRDGVLSWAQTLHEHQRCSRFIHDLVDLVMKDLLVIEAADRINAPDLCVRFIGFLKNAEDDNDYLCTPIPRSKEESQRSQEDSQHSQEDSSRIESVTVRDFSKTSPSKKTTSPRKVAFQNEGSST